MPKVDALESLLDTSDKMQGKLDDLAKEVKQKGEELTRIQAKLDESSKQLNDMTVECGKLKIIVEKDKELKDALSSQLADLKKKLADLDDEAKTLKKSVLLKDEAISTKDKQIIDKDHIISTKDDDNKKLNVQITDLTSKVAAFQDQILALQKENEQVKLKEEKMKAQMLEVTEKYDKAKSKIRDSGDSALGATMELEKFKTQLQQKETQVTELSGRLGSILTGGSGVLTDKEKLIEVFKAMVHKTQRSIRFCVPSITLLESLGLLAVIKAFPRTAVVQCAGDIKATDEHIIMDLKQKGVIFTQYDLKDRWVINRDGEDVIIALEKADGHIIGFYSNEPRFVSVLNSVVMEPWVKGIKI